MTSYNEKVVSDSSYCVMCAEKLIDEKDVMCPDCEQAEFINLEEDLEVNFIE